jgi:hypothetical protein
MVQLIARQRRGVDASGKERRGWERSFENDQPTFFGQCSWAQIKEWGVQPQQGRAAGMDGLDRPVGSWGRWLISSSFSHLMVLCAVPSV